VDPQASARISVRQLLIQTSSLPTTPGWAAMADFEYTNTSFDLLGLIVEAASGEHPPASYRCGIDHRAHNLRCAKLVPIGGG
jgi:CubicO group peptidase (beta-lactamase class C family)